MHIAMMEFRKWERANKNVQTTEEDIQVQSEVITQTPKLGELQSNAISC
jgi:hypothetical protein